MSREPRFLRDDILEDMVTLCDGLLSEFGKGYSKVCSWREKSLEEKKDWCENFAREHAHDLGPDYESIAEITVGSQKWEDNFKEWTQNMMETLKRDMGQQCMEQLLLTGYEKQTLLQCISVALQEGLIYKDVHISKDRVMSILVRLGVEPETIGKALQYGDGVV